MDLTTLPNPIPTGTNPYAGIPNAGTASSGATDPMTAFIRGIAQLIGAGGSLGTASGDMDAARNAANVADPFASQRGTYQPMLHDFLTNPANNPMNATAGATSALGRLEQLMQNPGQITSMPGYQFGLNQSLEAVNRGAGASGMLNSGNRLTALQDRGEGYAHSWYDDVFGQMMGDVNANLGIGNQFLNAQGQGANQLLTASGATTGSPSEAARALMLGRQQQAGSIGAGIGGVASGLTNLLPGLQRWLNSGGTDTSGFNIPGGVPGMGTGGDSGLMPGGSNGDWDVGALPIGSGGDYGLDIGGGLGWIDTLGG